MKSVTACQSQIRPQKNDCRKRWSPLTAFLSAVVALGSGCGEGSFSTKFDDTTQLRPDIAQKTNLNDGIGGTKFAFVPGITETQGPGYSPKVYVDYQSGNDRNPGTQSLPLKHAPGMPGYAGTYKPSPGEVIALKRGSVWRKTSDWVVSSSGTASAPIVFTAYGNSSDPLPQYTVLELYNSGWIRHSGDVWKRHLTGTLSELFVDDVGMGRADDNSPAKVGAISIVQGVNTGIRKYWAHSSGVLYLYSPGGDPGKVSLVEGLQSNIKFALSVINQSHLFVDRIEVRGGYASTVRFVANGSATSTNLRFTNGRVTATHLKGLMASGYSSKAMTQLIVKWNTVDSRHGKSMRFIPDDESTLDGGHLREGGGADGISFWDGVQNSLISQNYIKDFGHSNIRIGSQKPEYTGCNNRVHL